MPLFTFIKYLYIAVNALFVLRLFFLLRAAKASWLAQVLPCLVVIALSVAFPVARQFKGDESWLPELTFFGTLWMAFFLHVLLLSFAVNVFRLVNYFGRWIVVPSERLPRRRLAVFGVVCLCAALVTAASWVNTQFPTLREITLSAPVERPLRIAALSDTHLGRLISPQYFSKLVDLIEPQKPDLVVFMGDILDDHYGFDPAATRASLGRLNPKLGVWGILGNHEYIAGRGERSAQLLEQGGIRILRDAWVDLGGQLLLIGRDDYDYYHRRAGKPRKTLPQILANLSGQLKGKPRILLDHQPIRLEEAEAARVFLQLSGHTHNGQLFPFNFLVAFMYENAYGHSQRGNTHYWVSSGAGTWGPRGRTTGRPEILLIDLIPE